MADERIEVESIIGEITLAGENTSRIPKLYASKRTDIWRMKKNIHHKELFEVCINYIHLLSIHDQRDAYQMPPCWNTSCIS